MVGSLMVPGSQNHHLRDTLWKKLRNYWIWIWQRWKYKQKWLPTKKSYWHEFIWKMETTRLPYRPNGWNCSKLDGLLRVGKISKDQMIYIYLSDTVAKFYDKRYTYDADVIKFYSTIMYLGGRGTFNFLHGPMFYGEGRMHDWNRDFNKIRMNLRGP